MAGATLLEDGIAAQGARDVRATRLPIVRPEGIRWVRAIVVGPGNGVRSAGPAPMRMVCNTGMFSLDAALQRRQTPGWVVLGQVFDRNDRPAGDLQVVLHVDEDAADISRTDIFGEFTFQSRPGRKVGVALHGAEPVFVELWPGE